MNRKILLFFISLFFITILSSCESAMYGVSYTTQTQTLSSEATKEQQQEVKNQVMKLLEEEYKQPFELESFDYKYETHNIHGSYEFKKYGTYYFKVKAVDNPIIEKEFNFMQENTLKESIDSFKKEYLKRIYCSGLSNYYDKMIKNKTKVNKDNIEIANKYCSDYKDRSYIAGKDYYLKHANEYK